eukprot:5319008-Prymnesium_polylepis.1
MERGHPTTSLLLAPAPPPTSPPHHAPITNQAHRTGDRTEIPAVCHVDKGCAKSVRTNLNLSPAGFSRPSRIGHGAWMIHRTQEPGAGARTVGEPAPGSTPPS